MPRSSARGTRRRGTAPRAPRRRRRSGSRAGVVLACTAPEPEEHPEQRRGEDAQPVRVRRRVVDRRRERPQSFSAFHTIDGSAPAIAARIASHAWRSQSRRRQIVHATMPTATGRTCALCQSASPTTSPKTAARARVGRSAQAEPEEQEERAVQQSARVEAVLVGESLHEEGRPDPGEAARRRCRRARRTSFARRARRRGPRARSEAPAQRGARPSSDR